MVVRPTSQAAARSLMTPLIADAKKSAAMRTDAKHHTLDASSLDARRVNFATGHATIYINTVLMP